MRIRHAVISSALLLILGAIAVAAPVKVKAQAKTVTLTVTITTDALAAVRAQLTTEISAAMTDAKLVQGLVDAALAPVLAARQRKAVEAAVEKAPTLTTKQCADAKAAIGVDICP